MQSDWIFLVESLQKSTFNVIELHESNVIIYERLYQDTIINQVKFLSTTSCTNVYIFIKVTVLVLDRFFRLGKTVILCHKLR